MEWWNNGDDERQFVCKKPNIPTFQYSNIQGEKCFIRNV